MVKNILRLNSAEPIKFICLSKRENIGSSLMTLKGIANNISVLSLLKVLVKLVKKSFSVIQAEKDDVLYMYV